MDDRKVGLVIRALRRRRGWRQLDLAKRSGISQSLVSIIERGHLDATSVRSLRRLLLALDAALWLELRWRGGEVGRLLDEDHARLAGRVAQELQATGWTVRTEITYAEFSERGSFDVIAWHASTRTLLVVEVKTELDSAEATFRKLDEKVRLAPKIARERFGWMAQSASRLLIVKESTRGRERIRAHTALFDAALPARAVVVRAWLSAPVGQLDGLLLLRLTSRRGAKQQGGGRDRVRCRGTAA
jgi:transcriptional regulator with XRE-family HTH domain